MAEPSEELKLLEQKTKTLLETIKRIDSYIASTNTKCTIVMSYCAAVIGLISILITRIIPEIKTPEFLVFFGIFTTIIAISSTYCIYKSVTIIFPVTFSSTKAQTGDSMFFFGDIARHTGGEDGYRAKVINITEKEIIQDLSGQIFTVSTIASVKFEKIKTLSLIMVIFNVVPTGILMIGSALYFFNKGGLF